MSSSPLNGVSVMPNATEQERCTLLNGGFNDFIQVMLGVIALSVLIFKRYHEHPMRPVKIWMFDASKQLIGAGVAHVANMTIAIILTGLATGSNHPDQCAFYFVNFTMDTSFGVAVNFMLLKVLVWAAFRFNLTSLQVPGDYGHPIQVRVWAIQLITWLVIICTTKLIIGAFIYALETPLGDMASWLFAPLINYPKAELVIVMVACPVLMNGLQFWIQDNFLKKPASGMDSIPSDEEEKSLSPSPSTIVDGNSV
ncbi:Aste57867_15539 [Aphanomyces stellatus]|uniref:Aste57867_15539 protein n=1 Tax=Aphanomyces stellatus TaxID=120398 RepID=A0A485L4Q0_9STRA|nr:hypothetical protein As57867_015483 [Aphanomyces stellatus]VFT92341.1 Aste57867_15539 [Aphanomyces stellatus]